MERGRLIGYYNVMVICSCIFLRYLRVLYLSAASPMVHVTMGPARKHDTAHQGRYDIEALVTRVLIDVYRDRSVRIELFIGYLANRIHFYIAATSLLAHIPYYANITSTSLL